MKAVLRFTLVALAACAFASATVSAQPEQNSGAKELGHITFDTTANAQVQEAFLRGVLHLHSFGFEEAAAKATTERDRGLLGAVEILFGEGETKQRTLAYAERMGELAEKFPEDQEVQAFYSVALGRQIGSGSGRGHRG